MNTLSKWLENDRFFLTFWFMLCGLGWVMLASNLAVMFSTNPPPEMASVAKYSNLVLWMGVMIAVIASWRNNEIEDGECASIVFGCLCLIAGALGIPGLHGLSIFLTLALSGTIVVTGGQQISETLTKIREGRKNPIDSLVVPSEPPQRPPAL